MKKLTFRHFLIFSLLAHIIFIFVFIIFDFDWNFSSKKNIMPTAIRIDVVSLPDITPPPKKKIKKKSKSSIKIKDKTKKKMVKKKEAQKNSISKDKKSYKGNQISKGTGDDGVAGIMANIYVTEITGIIKSHWNIPSYIKDQNLKAELEVRIDRNGSVKIKKIIRSSGNAIFDSKVLDAIENSTPFPPPPLDSWKLIKDGIVFILNSKDD